MKKLEEKSTTGKELGTSLLGIITTIITVGACSWIEINWNLLIYSFMFWFIIPVGAVGAGFVAASGYYFLGKKSQKALDPKELIELFKGSNFH